MPQAPAGWYQLPNGLNQYWNGSRWVPTPPPNPTTVPMHGPAQTSAPALATTPPMTAMQSGAPARATGLSARLSGMSALAVVGLAAVVGVPASLATVVAATGMGMAFTATSESGTVTKIVDGDTFDVRVEAGTKRVRLLNVDTPESVKPGVGVQCLSLEATAALTQMMPVGSSVKLGYDTSRLDQYGRTLAGVTTADGVLVNAELARLGLGLPVVVGSNRKYEPAVTSASLEAQEAKLGLFSPTSSCSVAADAAKVEEAAQALEAAPAPTTPAEADALLQQAAALAVLASTLDTRLKATDAFEVGALPATAVKGYLRVAAAATSRANVVQASATASNTEFQRIAQEKVAAAAAAQAKAAADAQAKAVAVAQAKAVAVAQAKAVAVAQAKAVAVAQAKATADAQAKAKAAAHAKAAAAAEAKRQTLLAAPKKTTSSSGSGSGTSTGSSPGSTSTSGCVIKGNISSSGEKIFHVPGGGSYNATKIDLSKGERWFCSDSAAINAGWRKARN